MNTDVTLVFENGTDKGRKVVIPPAGARFGRSSKNDVVLNDAVASRYHCRFHYDPNQGLCVSDLGSANKTLVNDKPVQEHPLAHNDRVLIGDTILRVEYATPTPVGTEPVDLGLRAPATSQGNGQPRKPLSRGLIVGLIVALLLVCCAPFLAKLVKAPSKTRASTIQTGAAVPVAAPGPLTVDYEKVLADTTRIFRYHLTIRPDRRVAIRIDDTDSTHILEDGAVRQDLLDELARYIDGTGFFALDREYQGLQPNVLDAYVITVTIGKQTHRVRVANRAEPPAFRAVRDKLEDFGQVELGLWAVQYPPEKLREMAQAAFLQGRKLYDEREVKLGNLAQAIKGYEEADFYLRTVEPKPDYYADMLAAITTYRAELQERYVNQSFLAERAVRLRNWREAAENLRILLELIPMRDDPRHEEARTTLLEVESRLADEK